MIHLPHLHDYGEYTSLSLEHLLNKAKVSRRLELNLNPKEYQGKRTHWVNHTGHYHHQEDRKGPKYWIHRKSPKIPHSIRTYTDLVDAIHSIAAGDKNHTDYKGVTGINYERLQLAQSWKDRGREYHFKEIMQRNHSEIKEELGFGKVRYGIVFHD